MKMKKDQNAEQPPTNVEFGLEFGDINAAKWFDRPFESKEKREREKKRKK